MPKSPFVVGCVLLWTAVAAGQAPEAISSKYRALKHSPPLPPSTWAVLDRDGANQKVAKYLSSLGRGEAGTGTVVSPAFRISVDKIVFTVCGHDGQHSGEKKNLIALVDAKTGERLRETPAPGADALQERSWDVADLHDREVRVEVYDGHSGGAYAWMGVGRIDAGTSMQAVFDEGLPEGWVTRCAPAAAPRSELVLGGIPFRRNAGEYTMIPAEGVEEIACGVVAKRLFFLGGTIASGLPGAVYGSIELVYRDGSSEKFPLQYGFTLELAGKRLSRSKAMHLHSSGDVFEHYFVVAPKSQVIDKIILRRTGEEDVVPRITAVTCETQATGENLETLPATAPSAAEEAWIQSHAITSKWPDMAQIVKEIRRVHKLP